MDAGDVAIARIMHGARASQTQAATLLGNSYTIARKKKLHHRSDPVIEELCWRQCMLELSWAAWQRRICMKAIQSTLSLIQRKLDSYFKASDPRAEDWVDHQGSPYEPAKDKIVVILAGIQHETTISTHTRTPPLQSGQYAVVTPPLYISLHLLCLANFYDRSDTDGSPRTLAMATRAQH